MTEKTQKYLEQQLSVPESIFLFEIVYQGTSYYFCSSFRQTEVWWNSHKWEFLPLQIENYRFSEENSSTTPTITLLNLAMLYNEALAAIKNLIKSKIKFYIVFADQIKETSGETQSSLYQFKTTFILSKKLSVKDDQTTYQLDPVGFMYNSFAPARLAFREGLFNLAFKGISTHYAE